VPEADKLICSVSAKFWPRIVPCLQFQKCFD
jgi:hypothetical protein